MNQSELELSLVCTKCGADRVANSQYKILDRLIMCFIPKRPYRCLRCYHRFWKAEPFFASYGRSISWVAVIAAVFGLSFLFNWNVGKVDKPKPFSDFGSSPNAVPGQLPDELIDPNSIVQPAYINNTVSKNAAIDSVDESDDSADLQAADSQPPPPTPPTTTDEAALPTPAPTAVAISPAARLEELYTTEQLQKRLSLAKATAKQAEEVNLRNQARLRESMGAEQDELQSLLKVDINFRIDQWRKAWEMGVIEDYLSFYSDEFTPAGGISLQQWVAQRRQRIRPSKKINLVMDNYDVVFSNNNSIGTVTFDQVYKAGLYVESSRKQLVLRKQKQEWKILSETETSTEAAQ